MSEGETRQWLQALEADEDLAALRRLPALFNIFEATGDVRHEQRHSHLLYFLLNPRETHGLKDTFIQSLLQRALPLDDFASTFNTPNAWTTYREYSFHYVDERTVKDILEGTDMANLLQQYIEQGLEQGLEQGTRNTIRTVLRSRFGSLPEAVERRIAVADGAGLDTLDGRAGTVKNLDEL